jgi:hypothetical protein
LKGIIEMSNHKKSKPINLILLPLKGMCLFIILYFIAALQYTNMSDTFSNKVGFSVKKNYLCDLLNVYNNEGVINPARTTARVALAIICLSMILLWYQLPKLFSIKRITQTIMQVSGIISMVILLFLQSQNHDIIIRIAGVFGLVAVISILIELYRDAFYGLFILGLFFLALFLFNYYIYETGVLLELLPLIQKFTFIICLGWLAYLNIKLYLQLKPHNGY